MVPGALEICTEIRKEKIDAEFFFVFSFVFVLIKKLFFVEKNFFGWTFVLFDGRSRRFRPKFSEKCHEKCSGVLMMRHNPNAEKSETKRRKIFFHLEKIFFEEKTIGRDEIRREVLSTAETSSAASTIAKISVRLRISNRIFGLSP